MQQTLKMFNRLMEKDDKLRIDYDELINVHSNDWKEKVRKHQKNEMKRHFEMWLAMNCMNCAVKVRAQGTMMSIFIFIFCRHSQFMNSIHISANFFDGLGSSATTFFQCTQLVASISLHSKVLLNPLIPTNSKRHVILFLNKILFIGGNNQDR